ncbi:3-oxoacyl-ACP reductase FabG [Moheibacter lacus]|uniref:3-oxoacyl-ACP reductase FabG n=1 Tax=Moheibacter lacus TaxID=2745851 RepID=A0A838ZR56_9FLAO|nr:3-oxoacyl-ACP reductase FabG [Moheibacter lacus]MBA5628762.1 3-oxoacyl-ACP reductase FabG [Moheibacter lacus]
MSKEKYALITGGSRGIGRETAVKISKELGYAVLINYQSNQTAAEETLKIILENGGKAELIQFDVNNKEDVNTQLNHWKETHPDAIIEIIVNNAGITRDGLLMFMEDEDWDKVLNTTLSGFYNVTRNLIQDLLKNRYGRIINVASVSGMKGTPGQVNYSAAKAGLIGATKALAQEIAKRNITVNAVAPGFIETDMTSDLDQSQLKNLVPLNRFGKAEEVADLICFLASSKASYITGETININGGIYA